MNGYDITSTDNIVRIADNVWILKNGANEDDLNAVLGEIDANGGGHLFLPETQIDTTNTITIPALTRVYGSRGSYIYGDFDGVLIEMEGTSMLDGVSLRNKDITNVGKNIINVTGSYASIINCRIMHSSHGYHHGIYLHDVYRINIANNWFYNLDRGITLHGAVNITITGNNFYHCDNSILLFEDSSSDETQLVSISGNTSINTHGSDVYMRDCRYITISGNAFSGAITFIAANDQNDISMVGNRISTQSGSPDSGEIAHNET